MHAASINHRLHLQRARALLVKGLAAVGAVWLSFHTSVWIAKATRPYWRTERPAATFLSPGRQFKAVVFVSAGGGPGRFYCGVSVYVVPAETSDAAAGGDTNLVYSGACGGMSEGHWQNNLIWRGPNLLQIGFNPVAGAGSGGLTIRSHAVRERVNIRFSFQSGEDSW